MPRSSGPVDYDEIKRRFAEERDLRLAYRPEGTAQFETDLTGPLARYEIDPYADGVVPRDPIDDTVEVLFIGGGFSALLTAARLRQVGLGSIRIVERGADVGGTCTPGYYNFEGESNRRQDGNYNGGFPAYVAHMAAVRGDMDGHFVFTGR